MKKKNIMEFNDRTDKWIITGEVYEQIRRTIGIRRPEHGGILGSSDGVHIDYYFFDEGADRTSASYTMNVKALNEVIHEWNDNGINLVGIIHSHPMGYTKPSVGDMQTAKHIIETINVEGKFFTPIVQVSPKLNGDIKIYPYTFEQVVDLREQRIEIEPYEPYGAEKKQLVKLDKKAKNRFKRIEKVLPIDVMSKKTLICVGCGGSLSFLESMARCGVGRFVLIDGDKAEDTNIATQGVYISEIGLPKVEIAKARIHNINPMAEVVCINGFLDDHITDAWFSVD